MIPHLSEDVGHFCILLESPFGPLEYFDVRPATCNGRVHKYHVIRRWEEYLYQSRFLHRLTMLYSQQLNSQHPSWLSRAHFLSFGARYAPESVLGCSDDEPPLLISMPVYCHNTLHSTFH